MMDGPSETTSSQFTLPTPRASLQNVGEKRDKDEEGRGGNSFQAFGADGFTFLDFLDIINPLQHIPVLSTVYREMTGDEIDPGSRIAGGTLFGGPIGATVALVDVAVEQSSGQDMGEHMMALFTGEDAPGEGVVLANSPPPADFVTAAGVSAEELADAAEPITTNAEVLEWARRETSRVSHDDNQARLKTPTANESDIAANIEVLNWARQEAALSRSSVETADATTLDTRDAERQDSAQDKLAALNTTIAMGRDQSQLNGAAAPLGGWFSETMLVALAKYDESAQLGKPATDRRVEESTNRSE
ncbi:MAG: hypothetical protein H8E36_12905 [Rhodospirillaceae bacterium]|nr:hypothetical protein [Rhodospirillaceae bacterium]MBL6931031.1 hypothetical protein [Rhodospirillales bacterium]